MVVAMRRQRTRSCEHLRRRRPPPGIPRPVRLRETHQAWPRTPLATDPTRSGTHAACGASRRHTMPSAQAAVKRGGGAGRTSVSQSLRPDRSLVFAAHSPMGARTWAQSANFLGKWRARQDSNLRPSALEGRAFPIWRNNADQRGTKRNNGLFFRSFSGRFQVVSGAVTDRSLSRRFVGGPDARGRRPDLGSLDEAGCDRAVIP